MKKKTKFILASLFLALGVSCASTIQRRASIGSKIDMSRLSKHPIKKIQANGLEFAYIEAGEGPLVFFIHGFPDNASTWDEAIEALAKQGYRAVAHFSRGYYPSQIAPDGDYQVKTLASDVLAIMDALGEKEVYVVGHDWGASTAYAVANLAPERVKKLVTLAIPHPAKIKVNLALLMRASHFVLFQFPGYGEWYTRNNNYAYIDYLYDYWSPKWSMPERQRQNIKDSFALPGYLEAALGYYRSLAKSGEDKAGQKLLRAKTTVPTLCFAGGSDGALDIKIFDNSEEQFTNGYEFVYLEDGGHFIQNQYSELFVEKISKFFKE